MFDLKRPCITCPFRIGQGELFRLPADRLAEIVNAPAFQCHKTVDYSDDEPGAGEQPQQCAGLMAVLHRSNLPNQIMQVGERLGGMNPDDLDPCGEAYPSLAVAIAAHTGRHMLSSGGYRRGKTADMYALTEKLLDAGVTVIDGGSGEARGASTAKNATPKSAEVDQ